MTKRRHRFTAKSADKHTLYQLSVQEPEADIQFINRVYQRAYGKKPLKLREDFCGSALFSTEWVRSDKQRSAIGLDLDKDVLKWAVQNNINTLNEEQQKRIKLHCKDVTAGHTGSHHAIVAFNFSYCVFKQRSDLLRYFKRIKQDLAADGIFFMDMHGGVETFIELEESQRKGGFTYVWDQTPYDAINGHAIRHIHFRFPDGTALKKAFTYDWRLWTMPEVKDILSEAGFRQIDVYWEGPDGKGGGNGIFRKVNKANNEDAWIAYIAAS